MTMALVCSPMAMRSAVPINPTSSVPLIKFIGFRAPFNPIQFLPIQEIYHEKTLVAHPSGCLCLAQRIPFVSRNTPDIDIYSFPVGLVWGALNVCSGVRHHGDHGGKYGSKEGHKAF